MRQRASSYPPAGQSFFESNNRRDSQARVRSLSDGDLEEFQKAEAARIMQEEESRKLTSLPIQPDGLTATHLAAINWQTDPCLQEAPPKDRSAGFYAGAAVVLGVTALSIIGGVVAIVKKISTYPLVFFGIAAATAVLALILKLCGEHHVARSKVLKAQANKVNAFNSPPQKVKVLKKRATQGRISGSDSSQAESEHKVYENQVESDPGKGMFQFDEEQLKKRNHQEKNRVPSRRKYISEKHFSRLDPEKGPYRKTASQLGLMSDSGSHSGSSSSSESEQSSSGCEC